MLSEFIHFNIIHSHPQLQKTPSLKFDNAKHSLQIPKNAYLYTGGFYQTAQNQELLQYEKKSFHQSIKPLEKINRKINNIKSIQSSQEYQFNIQTNIHPKIQANGTSKKTFNNQNCQTLLQTRQIIPRSNSKQFFRTNPPLIQSPSRPQIFRQSFMEKKDPLINSKLYKSLRKNNSERQIKFGSTPYNKNLIFSQANENISPEKNFTKKFLFKSASHKNLSPLKSKKQKLQKIIEKQNIYLNSYTIRNKINKIENKSVNTSSSFKKALQMSKYKKKQSQYLKGNDSNGVYRQNEVNLNQQYYDIKTSLLMNKQIQMQNKQNINCLQNKLTKYSQKVIKNSTKKQQSYNQKVLNSKNSKTPIFKKPVQFSFQNQSSYIDDIVNNSNMNSLLGQQDSKLNMQPY